MILITGAGGFIGSNILEEINKLNEKTVIIDDFDNKHKWDFIKEDSFFKYYNISELDSALKLDYSMIIHMGAITNTTEDDDIKLNYYNYEYSKKLWKYCVKKQIPLIYASSAATYGDGSNGFSDKHETINKLKPLNKYGLSKHRFDLWCLKQKKTPPSWYGLKFFNVYGKNEDNKGNMASVVHWGTKFVNENKYIKLFKSNDDKIEDGCQKRDFVFCKDITNIIIFLKNEKINSGIYNVGTGKARTFNALANNIFKGLSINSDIRYVKMPKKLFDKYQNFTEGDITKIEQAGFTNFTSLEDGVKYCIDNFKFKRKII